MVEFIKCEECAKEADVLKPFNIGSYKHPDGRWEPIDLMLCGSCLAVRSGTVVVDKVGRNDPCPCGSGKKFKKCCG
jgi:hypothetical protein